MTKILIVTVAFVAVALSAVAAAAVAGAHSSGHSRPDVSVFLPGDPPAGVPATGDQFLTVDPVLDPHSGEHIGTAVTRVVIAETTEDDVTFILDCTVQLSEGNLNFYGAETFSSFADGVTYTVVGGTGRYHGTRGVVDITGDQVDGQPGSLLAFDLTRR